jgi:hypothetical protein
MDTAKAGGHTNDPSDTSAASCVPEAVAIRGMVIATANNPASLAAAQFSDHYPVPSVRFTRPRSALFRAVWSLGQSIDRWQTRSHRSKSR